MAAVTDLHDNITGVNRTWLDPRGFSRTTLGKAPLACPRKAMGGLLGNAVRFGTAFDVLAAGEGIESVLSGREILPTMPMAAALTAAHFAGLHFPSGLRRLRTSTRICGYAGAVPFASICLVSLPATTSTASWSRPEQRRIGRASVPIAGGA